MNRLQSIRRLLQASVFAIFTAAVNGLRLSYQDSCYPNVSETLEDYTKNRTSDFANRLRYYDRAHNGSKIWDNRTRITLDACYRLCGRSWEYFLLLSVSRLSLLTNSHIRLYPLTDILERISIWVVPLLLLVGNFQLAPLGPFNSICVIIHLLGDPIDSMWSLLTKLEVSRRLYTKWATISAAPRLDSVSVLDIDLEHPAVEGITVQQVGCLSDLRIDPTQAQDLAAVNAVFDDWVFSSEEVFDEMRNKLSSLPAEKRAVFITACTEAAYKLSESRVDDRLRTYLAVVGYIVAIISAFFRTLNDGPSKMTGMLRIPPIQAYH
jgi:hypothetical protein